MPSDRSGTVTVVEHPLPVCALCRWPLRRSRSVEAGACCCCRGDHAPDRYLEPAEIVAVYNAPERAVLVRPGGAGAVGPGMTASGGDTGPLVTPTAPAHRSDI